MDNRIVFLTDDDEEITFYVEEETKVNGISYLLVSDAPGDDANACILKDISTPADAQASYIIVEDDVEFNAVAELFSQMLEDTEVLRLS